MKAILNVIILFSLLFGNVLAQIQIIAKVNNDVITDKEFIHIYETSFKLLPTYLVTDTSRYNFLYSLIAYKLWYYDALDKGFKLNQTNLLQLDYIRKNLIKDILYKRVIVDNIKITKADKEKAYERMSKDLICYSIASPDSQVVFKYYNSLKKGFPFLSIYENDQFKNQNESIKITYGTLSDEKLEDMLFSLKQGEFTTPYKINNLWAIYYVDKIYQAAFTLDENLKTKADKILFDRLAEKMTEMYLKQKFSNLNYTFNNSLLKYLAKYITPNLFEKEDKNSKYYTVNNRLFLNILERTSKDSLNQVVIKTKNLNISYKDLLLYLYNNDVRVYKKFETNVYTFMVKSIPDLLKNEYLYAEAIRQGIDKDKEFIKEYQKWEEYFYGQNYSATILDTIGNAKKDKMLNNVNFQAILISNDSLEVFEKIFNEINDNNFYELAKKYSKNKNIDITINDNENSEFLSFVKNSNTNDVVGPFKYEKSYYLIKIKDKITNNQSDNAQSNGNFEKKNEYFGKYTASLAIKYGLKINENVLNSLELSKLNIITYKYLGFGGRILANPFMQEYFEWVKYWKQNNINP